MSVNVLATLVSILIPDTTLKPTHKRQSILFIHSKSVIYFPMPLTSMDQSSCISQVWINGTTPLNSILSPASQFNLQAQRKGQGKSLFTRLFIEGRQGGRGKVKKADWGGKQDRGKATRQRGNTKGEGRSREVGHRKKTKGSCALLPGSNVHDHNHSVYLTNSCPFAYKTTDA